MEIFNGAQKEKIAKETEPQQVTVRVSVALLSFIADNPNSDIDLEANKNPIILRRKAGGATLEITCDGPDTFHVKESMGLQRQVGQPRSSAHDAGPLTLSDLDRRVTAWLKQ